MGPLDGRSRPVDGEAAPRSGTSNNGATPRHHPRDLAEHAEAYVRAGLAVFPLLPRSKRPATAHGQDDATTNLEQIRRWWDWRPECNIGIRPSIGLVVLDEDIQHGGDKALSDLCYRHGELPETWTARTGQGGRHIWLRADPPFRGKLCDGVDIKHHSGYLVAPPSIHPDTGRTYAWLNDFPIAYAPHWLRPMLAPPPPRPIPQWNGWRPDANGALVRYVATRNVGNRNGALYWAVRKATIEGSIDQLRADLAGAAVNTGLNPDAVEATIESGIKSVRARR